MSILAASAPTLSTGTAGITGVAYDPAPGKRLPSTATFDPRIHLNYQPPSKTYTFDDLGLKAKGICPTAITEVRIGMSRFAIPY